MYPAQWFFRKHEDEPTTEVAIRRALAEDLYIVLAGFDASDRRRRPRRSSINPLVNWIWLGFGSDGVRHRHRAAAGDARSRSRPRECPPGRRRDDLAAAPALLLLPASLRRAGRRRASRQSSGARSSGSSKDEIMCTCGCRRPLANCGMPNCGGTRRRRDEAASVPRKARTTTRSWPPSSATSAARTSSRRRSTGFNRLAWLLPYLIGATGAAMVGFAAFKWSRLPNEAGDRRRRAGGPPKRAAGETGR